MNNLVIMIICLSNIANYRNNINQNISNQCSLCVCTVWQWCYMVYMCDHCCDICREYIKQIRSLQMKWISALVNSKNSIDCAFVSWSLCCPYPQATPLLPHCVVCCRTWWPVTKWCQSGAKVMRISIEPFKSCPWIKAQSCFGFASLPFRNGLQAGKGSTPGSGQW